MMKGILTNDELKVYTDKEVLRQSPQSLLKGMEN